MRSRLTTALAIALAGSYVLGVPALEAQEVPSDDEAWGGLIPGGAGVGAQDSSFQPSNQRGGSRRGPAPTIYCKLMLPGTDSTGDGASGDQLQTEFNNAATRGEDHILVYRVCFDRATGEAVPVPGQPDAGERVPWAPGAGGVVIDPALLADIARSRLEFPEPSGGTAPSLETGTFAQLATYFFVDSWEPVDASATAGSVTAVVTATPSRQDWAVQDQLRGETYTFGCEGPGVEFDPGTGAAPPAGACSWTPPHSSAGQDSNDSPSGQTCFPATVTITWEVSWDSNLTEPAALGTGTSAASTCIVVQEIQAVVTDG